MRIEKTNGLPPRRRFDANAYLPNGFEAKLLGCRANLRQVAIEAKSAITEIKAKHGNNFTSVGDHVFALSEKAAESAEKAPRNGFFFQKGGLTKSAAEFMVSLISVKEAAQNLNCVLEKMDRDTERFFDSGMGGPAVQGCSTREYIGIIGKMANISAEGMLAFFREAGVVNKIDMDAEQARTGNRLAMPAAA